MWCVFSQGQVALLRQVQLQLKKERAENMLVETRVREEVSREFSKLFSEMQDDFRWNFLFLYDSEKFSNDSEVIEVCVCVVCLIQWAPGEGERNLRRASRTEAGDLQEPHWQNGHCWTESRFTNHSNTSSIWHESNGKYAGCIGCLSQYIMTWFSHRHTSHFLQSCLIIEINYS